MSEYIEYDKEWGEIDPQDWPEVGEIFICKSPKHVTPFDLWAVAIMNENDSMYLGLFWEIEKARIFADALTSTKWERDNKQVTIPINELLDAVDKAIQSIIVEYMEVEQRAKQIEP